MEVRNNISFGSVTPIIATPKAQKTLTQILKASKGKYLLDDATELYKASLNSGVTPKGVLSEACSKGKKILFLITGKEYKSYMYMEPGWSSASAPTRHINRKPVTLNDESIRKMMNLFRRSELK